MTSVVFCAIIVTAFDRKEGIPLKIPCKRLIFSLLSLFLLWGCTPKSTTASAQIFAMDTIITLSAQGEGSQAAIDEEIQFIYEMEQYFSVTDEESDIWAINQGAGEWVEVSIYTVVLLENALEQAEWTEGAFDPTTYPALAAWGFTTGEYHVPDQDTLDGLIPLVDYTAVEIAEDGLAVRIPEGMMLDVGGIAKGFISDLIAHNLEDMDNALINLGGNTYAVGVKDDGEPWRIGIQDPNGDGYLAVVSLPEGGAVVTSGGYQRYFEEEGEVYWHILDPDTATPADTDLRSVPVTGNAGTACDVLSTALFVMGLEEACDFWRENQNFDMVLMDEHGTIYITQSLEANFALADGVDATVEVIVP